MVAQLPTAKVKQINVFRNFFFAQNVKSSGGTGTRIRVSGNRSSVSWSMEKWIQGKLNNLLNVWNILKYGKNLAKNEEKLSLTNLQSIFRLILGNQKLDLWYPLLHYLASLRRLKTKVKKPLMLAFKANTARLS